MAWNDYTEMSKRQRNNLFKRALSGNDRALRQYLQYTREIKKETNSRLAKLERANLDYGATYNNLMYLLQSEFDSNRLKSPTALGFDLFEMELQNKAAVKFLNNKKSLVRNVRESEKYRIEALQELGVIDEKFSMRNNREFLRFLGNEVVSATIDEYGISDPVVEMIYDAYIKNNKNSNVFIIMEKALTEFLADEITFDRAMERVGIKVEDYYSRKPTS